MKNFHGYIRTGKYVLTGARWLLPQSNHEILDALNPVLYVIGLSPCLFRRTLEENVNVPF